MIRKWTFDIPRYQRVQPRNLEEKRRKIYDSLHCGIYEYRTSISHGSLPQLIFGAVSSWCEDFAQRILGQTPSSVDKSISRVNDQISKKLDPTRTEEAAEDRLRD